MSSVLEAGLESFRTLVVVTVGLSLRFGLAHERETAALARAGSPTLGAPQTLGSRCTVVFTPFGSCRLQVQAVGAGSAPPAGVWGVRTEDWGSSLGQAIMVSILKGAKLGARAKPPGSVDWEQVNGWRVVKSTWKGTLQERSNQTCSMELAAPSAPCTQ